MGQSGSKLKTISIIVMIFSTYFKQGIYLASIFLTVLQGSSLHSMRKLRYKNIRLHDQGHIGVNSGAESPSLFYFFLFINI